MADDFRRTDVAQIAEALRTSPVVVVTSPRQAGKTTQLRRRCLDRSDASVIGWRNLVRAG
ncbi:MAG: hypothetical protein ACKVQR_07855 [Aquabacterium sp.]